FYRSGQAGGASTRIRVRPERGGANLFLSPGDLVELDESTSSFTVFNADGTGTIVGELVCGRGKFASTAVAGTVEVIDGGRARSLAGLAFGGYAFQAGAASNAALVQLWNPAGSGRRVVVERLSVVTDTNNGAWLSTAVAQLATVVGQGVSKLVGGAASAMQIRRANDPAFPAALPLDAVVLPNSATVIKGYNPVSPVVIPPGSGFTAWSTGPAGLGASFEWFEEPV
ncbi:MAG: hypothetical protein WCK28_23615, partial [Burkholderiales bacterium]